VAEPAAEPAADATPPQIPQLTVPVASEEPAPLPSGKLAPRRHADGGQARSETPSPPLGLPKLDSFSSARRDSALRVPKLRLPAHGSTQATEQISSELSRLVEGEHPRAISSARRFDELVPLSERRKEIVDIVVRAAAWPNEQRPPPNRWLAWVQLVLMLSGVFAAIGGGYWWFQHSGLVPPSPPPRWMAGLYLCSDDCLAEDGSSLGAQAKVER